MMVIEIITCKVYASSNDFFVQCLLVVALQNSYSLLKLSHLLIFLRLIYYRLMMLHFLFLCLLRIASNIGLPISSLLFLLCVFAVTLLNVYIVTVFGSQAIKTLCVSVGWVSDRICGSIAILFVLFADMGWIHVNFFFILSTERLWRMIILLFFMMLFITTCICL